MIHLFNIIILQFNLMIAVNNVLCPKPRANLFSYMALVWRSISVMPMCFETMLAGSGSVNIQIDLPSTVMYLWHKVSGHETE